MSGQYPYYYPTPAGSSRFPSSRPTQAPDNDSGYNTAPDSRRSTFSSDSHRTVASAWNTYPPSSLTAYGGARGAGNAPNYYNSSRYETPLYQPTPRHALPNLMGPPPTFRASPAPQRYNKSRASPQQSLRSPSGAYDRPYGRENGRYCHAENEW
ncbi:hypothetical protein B0A49_02609 [Cryomyces minteri]|uniref:Uncharacterized protein n=1 Tax=Cryomyces minteri TaxID=331657 RepID=A0A4U0XPK0_9PEZI|nr:hypothetical protein B0A49_02609 [Cryomyces minteri]